MAEKFSPRAGIDQSRGENSNILISQIMQPNNLSSITLAQSKWRMMVRRGDQIFFSATCPGQVDCKNPLVLRNFLLVPKYFSNRKSTGQVANTTISLPLNQSCR